MRKELKINKTKEGTFTKEELETIRRWGYAYYNEATDLGFEAENDTPAGMLNKRVSEKLNNLLNKQNG